jgi:glycosyltransferase involved in cell wall biosynthesis
MHIVYLTHEYPKKDLNAGGIGSFVQFLARNLVKQNIRVSVIGINNESKDIVDFDGDISIYRLAKSNWKFGKFYDHTNRILSKINDLDKDEFVNIVEGSELNFAFFPRTTSYKKIIRLHGGHHFFAIELNIKPAFWRSFQEKKSFKKAEGYIAVSDYVGRQTQKYLNFYFDYTTIYNSVDTDKFSMSNLASVEENTLLFVGTVCEKKGVRQLVQAMPLIKKEIPSIKLKIVGRDLIDKNGKSFTEYLKTYINNDLKNNIEILGPVPHVDIPNYIAKTHICVFPSHMESFGLVLLEALIMGKVVLASSIETFKEIKGKEPIFEFFNEITPENISKKVIELLNSNNETLKMGELARENIFKRFNDDTIIAKNIQYYNMILS